MQELNTVVNTLQEELKNLKDKMDHPSTPPDTHISHKTLEAEEMFAELSDREKRKSNLIIFNLPELENSSITDQSNKDICDVKEILTELNVSVNVTNAMRLGKYDITRTSRKRPLKIILPNEDYALEILRNCKNLKNSKSFKTISIDRDRTPAQINYYKAIKQQLDIRSAAGETGLAIKYVNGIPKIVISKPLSGN